jgi:hypothetical protein
LSSQALGYNRELNAFSFLRLAPEICEGFFMSTLLPLFPLDVVLLPGTPLPLHIFEPRYREMI